MRTERPVDPALAAPDPSQRTRDRQQPPEGPEAGRQAEARLEALLQHLERLLPDAAQRRAFRDSSLEPLRPSLRLNPLIPLSVAVRPFLQQHGQVVPWCADAFLLGADGPALGRTLEHALGAFYIQAKATTFAVEALDPQPGERVLDLAAAPGGKATHLAARLDNRGLLVVNEPQRRRVPALVGNLERCGVLNAVVSQAPGTMVARHFHNYFDRVLLDAPCSGDGLLRKDLGMLRYWSPEDACRKSGQQKGLLRAAFHALQPGGVLVYSTCSLSLEENEDVLLGLVQRYPGQAEILPVSLQAEALPLPADLAAGYPPEFSRAVRIWPHVHDTEGAFVARVRKHGPTAWPNPLGDASEWAETEGDAEGGQARERIASQWGFPVPCPEGQSLLLGNRYLHLQPRLAPAFRVNYPGFLRAGLHVARPQQGHYYLTHQAVALWGHLMEPRLELDWPQVQALFAGRAAPVDPPVDVRGEVVCCWRTWPVCRGVVEAGGSILQGTVPKALRCPQLQRLFL